MRRLHARLAAACVLAVATAVLMAGAAFAGGNGNGHGNGNGNSDQSAQPTQSQPTAQAQPAVPAKSHGNSDHASKSAQSVQSTPSTESSQSTQTSQSTQAGVKPSSTTKHWTHTTVGAKPDVSKRYGNGQTAAQIAASRGAPASQPLTGPGNSQPHKTYDCKHKNNPSGGVDVHAIKSYSATSCETAAAPVEVKGSEHVKTSENDKVHVKESEHGKQTETETTPVVAAETGHKITICHATGSATNPYVEITVDVHALKNGHTAAKGDIIPAPAGGCPTGVATVQTVSFCENGALMTASASDVVAAKLGGSDIVPPFTFNGQVYSANWPAGEATFNNHCVPVVAGQVPVTTTNETTTATTVTVTTGTTTTTANGGVAGTTQTTTTPQLAPAQTNGSTTSSSAGGVLGAQTSLSKPRSTPHRGVLGTVTHVAGGTLPFTGFPVWLAVVIAIALILAGFALRRRTLGTRV